jgi:toxin YoeB
VTDGSGDRVSFTLDGWEEYTAWQTEDKRVIKKINNLVRDIIRNGNEGIGHPEPLRGNLSGYWSREIDEKNRLVYMPTDDGKILIVHCNGHYGDT